MTAPVSDTADAAAANAARCTDLALLRRLVIAAGLCWAIAFVAVGVRYELQMYGDGSFFSYAVAVQDAWAFHWHNISGRLFVYLFSVVPAQAYVELSGDAHGGIVVYGFLFFVAQILGLLATFMADRSRGRIIFCYACASTAVLCPLVFGFPTEMWLAHALFWPALALCHYARGLGGVAVIFATLLTLVLTHEGAVVLEVAILTTVLLRGVRDPAFVRTAGVFLVVMAIWAFVKVSLRPDSYVGPVMTRAALHFFDPTILMSPLFLLLACALSGYIILFLVISRLRPADAHLCAAAIVAVALAAYWLWFDRSLHTDNRYYMRTVLLVGTLALSTLAAIQALTADGRQHRALLYLPHPTKVVPSGATARATIGAILVIMLVHAVETAKFVVAWTQYTAAVRALAMGTASDPALGDAQFVSSQRISTDLNRLSWFSTTHFLSVLVAPGFAPARLVVDPQSTYFSLSCATATANEEAQRIVPAESRRLVRVYACLHR